MSGAMQERDAHVQFTRENTENDGTWTFQPQIDANSGG